MRFSVWETEIDSQSQALVLLGDLNLIFVKSDKQLGTHSSGSSCRSVKIILMQWWKSEERCSGPYTNKPRVTG